MPIYVCFWSMQATNKYVVYSNREMICFEKGLLRFERYTNVLFLCYAYLCHIGHNCVTFDDTSYLYYFSTFKLKLVSSLVKLLVITYV